MPQKINKKAYFFMLDGLLAVTVLVTGFIIIGSIFVNAPIFKPAYNIGEDTLRILSNTNISNLDLKTKPGIATLFTAGKIQDNQSSILQQIAIFYYDYCQNGNAQALKDANITIYEILNNIIPHPYYAELNISGFNGCNLERIYTSYNPPINTHLSQQNAKTLMINQKIVFGNINSNTIYGPYISSLKIWR